MHFLPSAKVEVLSELVEIRQGRRLKIECSQPSDKGNDLLWIAKFYYAVLENGTILFIHGVGGSGWIWNKQVDHFQGKVSGIAIILLLKFCAIHDGHSLGQVCVYA